MTTTSSREHRATDPGSTPTQPGTALTPPPKLRRRPALVAAGALAVCLGALLAVWAWSSTTHTEEVLAARATIHRGQVITASAVERVRISGSASLDPLPASAYDTVVGERAALDVAAGGLLTADATTTKPVPAPGQSVVGISLAAAQLPAVALQGGDRVRIVATPGQNGSVGAGSPAFTGATVVDTEVDAASGNTIVDVLVPYADASILAARAAGGNVALVLDSAQGGGR